MKITPMAVGFGATIEGADLTSLSDTDAQQLRAALLEHGLLVIRAQKLSPQAQISVSSMFGEFETFPTARGQLDAMPEIFRVASRPEDGHVEVGRYWHSDGSFRAVPTPISIWHTVVEPEQGGETLFTDLQQAYATLPEALRAEVDGRWTMHRNGIQHPLVVAHPKTGIPALYLNVGLTASVLDVSPEQSAQLMQRIDQHYSRPGATYTHKWLAGDVVVADNLHVAHKATPTGPEQRRILNRTTIRSDAVYWLEPALQAAA
jgi:taurine dioxygenase